MTHPGASLADAVQTAQSWRIWNLLALQDIRQRYRRSLLGPFWLTLSAIVSIGALALVYTKIFKIPAEQYLPFLSVGFIFWIFLSSLITESCGVFIQSESVIKQISLPFGVHVMRMVWRNTLVLAHNSVVLVLVLAFMGLNPGPAGLLVVPALALALVAGLALGYLLGTLSARFRDIPPIVGSLMQVLFYVTPVIWTPDLLKGHPGLLLWNPVHHFLEILRAPLLGKAVPAESWAIALGMTAVLLAVAVPFFARFRRRIAFWL